MSADGRPGEASPDQRAAPSSVPDWWVYRGTGRPLSDIRLTDILPAPPPWRDFRGGPLPADDEPPADDGEYERRLGSRYQPPEQGADPQEADMVNAALFLRRPLLVTGPPGIGKSALPYRIARELRLGRVLRWPIVSHTTLRSGLYSYDAIGRAEAAGARRAWADTSVPPGAPRDTEPGPASRGKSAAPATVEDPPIGEFIRLGPLGTAFLPGRLPRVLLIDELDKSEPDLPNDLLSLFEDGEFTIPELERLRTRSPDVTVLTADPGGSAVIPGGRVRCNAFPMIVITSNGEREFPLPFIRRCVRLEMRPPDQERLAAMVAAHLLDPDSTHSARLIEDFMARSRASGGLPADKLLEAVYLATSGAYQADDPSWPRLLDALWRRLASVEG
jgi:MoxR-like ATPase